MGPIGMQEMIAIFIIALILFGPKKLPELGRTLAKALSEFRRAKNELKSTFESHLSELEREVRIQEKRTPAITQSTTPARHTYPYEDNQYEATNPSSSAIAYGTYDAAQAQPHEPAALSAPEPIVPAEHARIESAPVADTVARGIADTVARNNGIHPVEPVAVAPHEEHPENARY